MSIDPVTSTQVWRNDAGEAAKFEPDEDGTHHLSPDLMRDLLQRAGFRPTIAPYRAPVEALTLDELAVIDMAGDLYNALCDVVADGPSRDGDLAELAAAVHTIQRAVMAQAAARAYPDRFRLLGSQL